METGPGFTENFRVYCSGSGADGEIVTIHAVSPYEAALAMGRQTKMTETEGEIVVISPNGMEARFGYRSLPPLAHLDD